MKRAVFVLASLLYGSASYAAGTEQRGNPDTVEGTFKFEGTFKNVKSKLCMGVARGDTKFGAYIKQGQCNKAPDQLWAVQPPGPLGFRAIKSNENRNLCLGVDNGSHEPGADIRLFTCDDKPNQRWKLERVASGVYRFKNRNSARGNELCIGVEHGATGRAQLRQGKCSAAPDQQWLIPSATATATATEPVPPTERPARGTQISFCVESPAVAGGHAIASGFNQHGRHVKTHKIELDRSGHGHCDKLPNWWFQGMVSIEWHDRAGNVWATTECAVPKVKSTEWIECDDIPVHVLLATWLQQTIDKNLQSREFDHIKSYLTDKPVIGEPANPIGKVTAVLVEFAKMVKPHAPWDYKDFLREHFGGRGYGRDPKRHTILFQWDRDLLSFDIWSNIHYGFIGRAIGIDASVLRLGHQLPGAGQTDDGDKLAVNLGIELHDKGRGRPDAIQIMELLRRHRHDLFKTGLAVAIDR
ncbi:MAG TPA: RICIN domain-containing protein [Kofleriaceae bacterium]